MIMVMNTIRDGSRGAWWCRLSFSTRTRKFSSWRSEPLIVTSLFILWTTPNFLWLAIVAVALEGGPEIEEYMAKFLQVFPSTLTSNFLSW